MSVQIATGKDTVLFRLRFQEGRKLMNSFGVACDNEILDLKVANGPAFASVPFMFLTISEE
jgi:hypothetical protein